MFFRRPLLVSRYDVYVADIAPMGIEAIELDGAVTPEAVSAVTALLADPDAQAAMIERNYAVGLEHMSHRVIRERLLPLLG